MARVSFYIFIINVYVSLISSIYGAKLNVPRVLLPVFNSLSTSYELEVTEAPIGGCFRW